MRDGTFTYYTLQHRRTRVSPWLKPNDKLNPVKDKEWNFSNWDVFGLTAEPWHGISNNWHPKFKKAHNETHECWANTGHHGWWTLKFAVRGLRRVRKADAEGKFDSKNGYGHHEQTIRREFRLVKITVSQTTKDVPEEDWISELASA